MAFNVVLRMFQTTMIFSIHVYVYVQLRLCKVQSKKL